MACRISELVIDDADPDRLAAFSSNVLGYIELGREDDGSIEIGPPDAGFGGPQPTLVLSPSSDPRTGKLRLHIDVTPPTATRMPSWSGCSPSAPGPPTSARPAPRAGMSWPTQKATNSASCTPGSRPSDRVHLDAKPLGHPDAYIAFLVNRLTRLGVWRLADARLAHVEVFRGDRYGSGCDQYCGVIPANRSVSGITAGLREMASWKNSSAKCLRTSSGMVS
jgi:hypothetical protein